MDARRIEQDEIRPADDVPSAGRSHRVDAGLRAGDRHAARGHPLARGAPSRRVQAFRQSREVRESGGKPQEADLVASFRMGAHDRVLAHAESLRDRRKVRPGVVPVANGDLERAGLGLRPLGQGGGTPRQLAGERPIVAPERIEANEERRVGGVEIDHASWRVLAKPGLEGAHVAARRGGHGLVEDDQNRTIAGIDETGQGVPPGGPVDPHYRR
jgi:hypothetical protein